MEINANDKNAVKTGTFGKVVDPSASNCHLNLKLERLAAA
ncbi:hypothetical protein CCACVL1_27432 [Corchorus capsularis]|uniref:Uncharacterized protein n=1 Tax=Corchorus capsularis TaxID=210143 RepID=A0A1R3GAF6_COCAP|nr:hypothetical protein CCACVL1_27432 [Corchorus capsularis]